LRRSVFHIEAGDRRLFALLSEPEGPARGVVVHVPAFAEEMNKSRRMVALAARAFADEGWAVLQFDLSGCGDSSGLFDEADWEAWREDLDCVVAWCRARFDEPGRIVLWGLRCGALLAGDWVKARDAQHPLLLWHPVLNGKLHLTQFLRLRVANDMLSDADSRNAMAEMRARLDDGKQVFVAGYALSPVMAEGMNRAVFGLPAEFAHKLAVFEVNAAAEAELSPATGMAVERWRALGVDVTAERVAGPAFWSTQYIETVPELIDASRRSLAWMMA